MARYLSNDPQHAANAYVAATGGKRRGSRMRRVLRSGVAHSVAHPEEALSIILLGAITGLVIARVVV